MIGLRFSIFEKIRCYQVGSRSAWKISDQVGKRGSVLENMIGDKDKNKKWYFHILQNPPKSKNVFEKVHRPHKRQSVLNSLFIKNITDVLSTGEIGPEFIGSGIEITGVKVNPSCKEVQVYWQIPPSVFDKDSEFATLLNLKAPKIRAELISRNVLGRVPFIIFIRDVSNAYLAKFEKALEEADCGPKSEARIVPEDTFTKTKKLFSFNSAKEDKEPLVKKKFEPPEKVDDKDCAPPRPLDMKCDVFGINHDMMMSKVITIKALHKPETKTNVISSVHLNSSTDLFSNIPGTTIDGKSDREKLLKEFHVQRKMLRKKEDRKLRSKDYVIETGNTFDEGYYDDYVVEEDFIEEES